jgi:hypothetical protein
MAQHDYNIANQGFPAFRTDLNNALSAIQTTNSGTSRPTGAVAGQLWLDTTSPTTPTLKYYDGADDISLATIDHSANTVNWLDSTVSITGLSTTATGTVLTLSDSVSTSTVNLIIDNQKEIRFRETTANGTNYVALKSPASLSADLTFTLPATDGTSGQVLQTNGSGVLSFATVGGLAWQTIVTGATLTAVAGRGYWIDTTSNACTVTLPASATNGDTIVLADYARKWGTNKITIDQNSLNFQGFSSPNPEYNTNGQSVTLVYSGATKGWIPTIDDDVTNETPQSYSVDFLVIAGGGSGGGRNQGGGGGSGGYRSSNATYGSSGGGGSAESSLTFFAGTVYTITVGAGGASAIGGQTNNGNNSSISGSDISTITSTAGGGGGTDGGTGNAGGSGGGGAGPSTAAGGAGTANQGFGGGTGGSSVAGGGGGASAVGVNGNVGTGKGGNGGAGVASTITGSSVTRAGGGGGYGGTTIGSGGTGGGGNGGLAGANDATAGTANTGGGGGGVAGSYPPNTSGAGGSGVVILRMPTAKYSSTTTGSPTVSTSGSDTILVYNSSGSYTG